MKYFFLFLFLILPLVNAEYSGSTESIYYFDNCDNLSIDINGSLQIITGEYSFLGNCSIQDVNHWDCFCDGDFDLKIKTLPNTINNYTFNITYYYQEIVKEVITTSSSSGRRSSSCIPNYVCGSWGSCINESQTRLCIHEGNCYFKPYNETQNCTEEITGPEIIEEVEEIKDEPIEELELESEEEKDSVLIICLKILALLSISLLILCLLYTKRIIDVIKLRKIQKRIQKQIKKR